MGGYDDPRLTGENPTRRGRRLAGGAIVAALVLGLAVGFVVGGGTSRDSSVAAVEVSAEPSPTPEPVPDPAAAADACAAVGTTGTEVLDQLNLAVSAIGVLDPGALREVLDRLQPLQAELQAAIGTCTAPGSR